MARRTQIILEDDVEGGIAHETITFALDGANYEIDLNSDNAAALRDGMAKWIGHSRRGGARAGAGRRTGRATSTHSNVSQVREWARRTGHKVSDRGRISKDLLAAYDSAHAG